MHLYAHYATMPSCIHTRNFPLTHVTLVLLHESYDYGITQHTHACYQSCTHSLTHTYFHFLSLFNKHKFLGFPLTYTILESTLSWLFASSRAARRTSVFLSFVTLLQQPSTLSLSNDVSLSYSHANSPSLSSPPNLYVSTLSISYTHTLFFSLSPFSLSHKLTLYLSCTYIHSHTLGHARTHIYIHMQTNIQTHTHTDTLRCIHAIRCTYSNPHIHL